MFDWLFPNVGALGHIYADNIINEMKGVSLPKAYEIISDAFAGAYKGKNGVTENDLNQLVKVLDAFGKQFKVDVDAQKFALSSAKDRDAANKKIDMDNVLYYISPKNLTGSTTGKNVYAEYSIDKNNTNWKDPSNAPSNKTNINKPTSNTNTGSAVTQTPSTPSYTGGYNNTSTPTNTTPSPSKLPVYEGAPAVAKAHGIDYDLNKILADYNQRTEDYYDAAILEQEADRTKYLQASNNYANRIMNEYLDSYSNAAATAAGRGTTAATALMTNLNNQYINTANDLGMLQSVNNLNESRKAELANNPYLAEEYYNELGKYLSQVSVSQYGNDVNKYVRELDAYAQRYAADRALAESQAQAASLKYAGLASNSLYKATQAANKNTAFDRLYNFYYARYNQNANMASNAVIKDLGMDPLGSTKAGDK